jgi:hypothetical protein
MALYRSGVYHSIPERSQRPGLLVHLIHARVRRRPTGRGMPGIIPRVHDELMNSDPHQEARSGSIKRINRFQKGGCGWTQTSDRCRAPAVSLTLEFAILAHLGGTTLNAPGSQHGQHLQTIEKRYTRDTTCDNCDDDDKI